MKSAHTCKHVHAHTCIVEASNTSQFKIATYAVSENIVHSTRDSPNEPSVRTKWIICETCQTKETLDTSHYPTAKMSH